MKQFPVSSPSAKAIPRLGSGIHSGKIPSGRVGGRSVLTSIRSLTKEEIMKIQHLINYLQEFRDENLREIFGEFLQQLTSTSFLVTVAVVFTFCLLPLAIYTFVDEFPDGKNFKGRNAERNILSIISMVFCFVATISGWMIYFHWNPLRQTLYRYLPECAKKCFRLPQYIHPEHDHVRPESTSSMFTSWKSSLSMLQPTSKTITHWYALFLLSTEIYFISIFLRRALNLNCDIPDSRNFILRAFGTGVCYEGSAQGQFLSFNSSLVILIPMLFFISMPEIPIRLVWLTFASGIIVCIGTAIYLGFYVSIPIMILFVAIAVFLIKDSQLRNILIFLTQQRLKEVIIENEIISHENHENEMKHLIANVAHDLKTVSVINYSLII